MESFALIVAAVVVGGLIVAMVTTMATAMSTRRQRLAPVHPPGEVQADRGRHAAWCRRFVRAGLIYDATGFISFDRGRNWFTMSGVGIKTGFAVIGSAVGPNEWGCKPRMLRLGTDWPVEAIVIRRGVSQVHGPYLLVSVSAGEHWHEAEDTAAGGLRLLGSPELIRPGLLMELGLAETA
jgi:hypothetical protein